MPTVAERERPRVPNHDLVRVIGRGAYGEIWMARSLTGALRAVKIVDQRTFESESSFQREFEGMARFEPISRSDAGFVDILHVGRDDGGHFFYYVMELADELSQTSAEFRTIWSQHDVRLPAAGLHRFHHPLVGELDLVFEAAELRADPGLTLLLATADEGSPTETALRRLLHGQA